MFNFGLGFKIRTVYIRDGKLKVMSVSIFRTLKSRGPENTKSKKKKIKKIKN